MRRKIVKGLDLKGITLKEASLAIGRNETYLHQFVNRGSPKSLNPKDAERLAEMLGLKPSELGGYDKADGSLAAPVKYVSEYDVRLSAGDGAFATEENVVRRWPFDSGFLSDVLDVRHGDLAIAEVRGDSMSPTLISGDRVLIDLRDKQISQPGIFVVWDGHGVVIKRVERILGEGYGGIRLISDNERHNPYTVMAEEVSIVGRVIWRSTRL